jgi:NAD(P)-dependent dehydrogenase (short-subunit alcohol dehydrogenase family)
MTVASTTPSTSGGRLAVVTGASSGIGRATALKLAQDGWRLTLVDRAADGLEVTAASIRAAYGDEAVVDLVVADLADTEQTESVASAYLRSHDVDLLVNNAGIGFRANAEDTTDEQWDLTFAVNLTAMFRLCRAVIPGMVERGHGVIINTASAGGLVGLKFRVAYCASKAGVIGLTRALAADHAAQGIRVNAIAPGTVDTEWVGRMLADDPDPVATRRMMENRQLDGQLGTPEEVAGGIAFMAGDEGRFFNGSVMVMDAGLTAV